MRHTSEAPPLNPAPAEFEWTATGGAFTFDSATETVLGASAGDDILVLDQACRARDVELIPNLQSFGHQWRRRLGAAVTAPTLGFPNSSGSALALFGDPLDSTFLRQVDAADIGELETVAAHAVSALTALPDREPRTDYGFVARLIAFAAQKVRASIAVRTALRSASLADLDAGIASLQAVRARLPAFRREFGAVWLRHARRSELHITLDAFDALDARFGVALEWLGDQRRRAAAGESVDADLRTYDPGQYLPLWERGRADLRRLTDLVCAPI